MVPFTQGFDLVSQIETYGCSYDALVLACGSQMGKALALDTAIATPSGWKTMADLRVGDQVFDERGKPCLVLGVSPILFGRECYEVEFCDGSTIVADAEHRWYVEQSITRRPKKGREPAIVTTAEMISRGVLLASGGARFAVPVAGALDLPHADLPLPPYVLGYWLGDGSTWFGRISVGDIDVDRVVHLMEAEGLHVGRRRDATAWDCQLSFRDGSGERIIGRRGNASVRRTLREIGVLGRKAIPIGYLRSSAEQRFALLQGLMDSDGWADTTACRFCSKWRSLAEQVKQLAASLGFRPRIAEKTAAGYTSYVVSFKAYAEDDVFRLKRKQARLASRSGAGLRPGLNAVRFVRAIRPVTSVPVKCIAVASPSRLYLAGTTLIPTHNTDSILDVIGSTLDQRPAPIMYVGPNKEFLHKEIEPRVMEMLTGSGRLSERLATGKRLTKWRKVVGGVPLALAWAGSATSLAGMAAKIALIDELDRMKESIGTEGDPFTLVEARGFSYRDRIRAAISTPLAGSVDIERCESGLEFWKKMPPEDIESPIWRLWQSGTRHHFAWPCHVCEEYFVPRFKILRWSSWPDLPSEAEAKRSAYLECPNCGGVIEEAHKKQMNAAGRYVAPGQTISPDGVVTGELPDTTTLSFWVSGLCSPFVTFGDRAASYVRAKASGEQEKLRGVLNTGFGELFAPGGGDVPEWEEVAALKRDYRRLEVPAGVRLVTLTADVQGNGIYYTIRGWGAGGTSWLIDFDFIHEPTVTEAAWSKLASVLTRPVGDMVIHRALIDSGFRPGKPTNLPVNMVYKFCRRFPRHVYPSKGRERQDKPVIVSKPEIKRGGEVHRYGLDLVLIDTDVTKSWVHERIRWEVDKPGAWMLPSDVTDDYCKQIVSEARVRKPNGSPEWVPRSRQNHYLDCEALQAALALWLRCDLIQADSKPYARPVAVTPAKSNSTGTRVRLPKALVSAGSAEPRPQTLKKPVAAPSDGDRLAKIRQLGRRMRAGS